MMIKPKEKNLADTHFHILIMTEALIEQSHNCEPILLADEFFYLWPSREHEMSVLLWPKKQTKMLNIMNQKQNSEHDSSFQHNKLLLHLKGIVCVVLDASWLNRHTQER